MLWVLNFSVNLYAKNASDNLVEGMHIKSSQKTVVRVLVSGLAIDRATYVTGQCMFFKILKFEAQAK